MTPLSINSISHLPIVGKDGKVTDEWRVFFHQLTVRLADQLHPIAGISLPQQVSTTIASIDPANNVSRILYDSTQNRFVGNQDGVIKKFVME